MLAFQRVVQHSRCLQGCMSFAVSVPRAASSSVPEDRVKKVRSAVERHVPGIDARSLKVEMAGAGVAVSQCMFKVTAGSGKYGVKLMDESAVGVDLSKFIDLREASLMLSAASLTPTIFGWDDSAIVRDYVGKVIKLKDLSGPEDFMRLGTAFAKLHSLQYPEQWLQIPSTQKNGYSDFFRQFCEKVEDAKVQKLFEDAINLADKLPAATGILGRLVLTHSDAKPGNVLRAGDKFIFIDLDMIALRPAYYDLTYAMFMWGGTTGDLVLDPSEPGSWFQQRDVRRTFASAYLSGCGFPHSQTDVDNFLFDLEAYAPHMMIYFAFVSHWLSLNPALPEAIKGTVGGLRNAYLTKVHLVHAEVLKAIADESKRHQIACDGVLSLID